MPSFTHFLAPAAPQGAQSAATHSRRKQAVRLCVLCIVAAIVACLAVGASPALAAFPGHNGKIAFTSDRDGGDFDIWTMSPKGHKLVNLTANSPADDQVASWSADGQKLAFMSNRMSAANPEGEFEIFVMNADGSDQTQITSNALDDEDPAWSPDGRQIVFVRDFGVATCSGPGVDA